MKKKIKISTKKVNKSTIGYVGQYESENVEKTMQEVSKGDRTIYNTLAEALISFNELSEKVLEISITPVVIHSKKAQQIRTKI